MANHFRTVLIAILSVIVSLVSCTAETDFNKRLTDLEGRVSILEQLCSEINSNISSLQGIVNALQLQDRITSVKEITSDGKVVGYTISFAKAAPITIYHGKDGKDGQDGSTPVIGVKQGADGIWYWTLNGEWLLDGNGQKVKAVGTDGKDGDDGDDGEDGQNGTDGITPQLKIEGGYWYVSTDKGKTWIQLGKASGEDGKDGDSMFQSVTVTETEVTFVTGDGQTFVVKRASELSIEFDSADLVVMGTHSTRNIHYTITSGSDEITVEALSSADIKVKVVKTDVKTGSLQVETGATIDEYSKVVVLVSNGNQAIMRTLNFEEEAIEVEEDTTKEVTEDGGRVSLEFFSNIPCRTVIPEEAQSWVSIEPGTKGLKKQTVVLILQPNTGVARNATIRIQSEDGALDLIYHICQAASLETQLDIERKALIAFYNATDGDNWTNNDNWCSDAPLSEWYGLTTDEKGRVIHLTMYGNNLSGTLPPEIGDLSYLYSIRITGSPNLGGPIPTEIGKLKKLTNLDMRYNNLSGTIPDSICDLVNLRELVFRENRKLSGSIPERIGNLKKIAGLDLSFCNLEGNLPESLATLENIYDCETSNNKLSGKVSSAFLNWPYWEKHWGDLVGYTNLDISEAMPTCPDFEVTMLDESTANSSLLEKNNLTIFFNWAVEDQISVHLFPYLRTAYHLFKDKGLEIIGYSTLSTEEIMRLAIDNYKLNWPNFLSSDSNQIGDNVYGFYPGNVSASLCAFDNTKHLVYTNVNHYSFAKDDYINDFVSFVSSWFDSDWDGSLIDDLYESTDYSSNGNITELQAATIGNGINMVFMGDGYSDRQLADGTYSERIRDAVESFFDCEPYQSFRDMFNVYMVDIVSKNEGITPNGQTALSCYAEAGSGFGGDTNEILRYAMTALPSNDDNEFMVVVLMNIYKYGGTCIMNGPDEDAGDYGSGYSISFIPHYTDIDAIIHHEVGGHGFAKLADEYVDYDEELPVNKAEELSSWGRRYGWYRNVDYTSDPDNVSWSAFLKDSRYKDEGLGVFEGASLYSRGVYRASEESIMRYNTGGFNAPSRYAIWYRIGKLAYGESWEGSYEDFVSYDQVNLTPAAVQRRNHVQKPLPPLPAPIVIGHSLRAE